MAINFFKKKEDNSPAKEDLQQAKTYFDEGDFREGFRALDRGFINDINYQPLYQLAADNFAKLHAEEEQQMFTAVLKNSKDADAYFRVGNFYFDMQNYNHAKVFYEKTLQLDPAHPSARHDIAICYARCFQIENAIEILQQEQSNDFWDYWFLYKCLLLQNRPAGVQQAIDELKQIVDAQQEDNLEVAMAKSKVVELQEILDRLNHVKDIKTHIRDWHFIQYGGAILDFFDKEGDDYVAGGRYVASWGSNEAIKKLAVTLQQLVQKLSLSFQSVVALPDRDSEITGRLFALQLGIDFEYYDSGKKYVNGLLVSADSTYLEEYEALEDLDSNLVVLCVNHNWLQLASITPDIIGFMTQRYGFPWGEGGIRITDFENGAVESIPADERSAEVIALEIYEMEAQPEDITHHLQFYSEQKEFLKGIGSNAGDFRYNFTIESPVPGSYFV